MPSSNVASKKGKASSHVDHRCIRVPFDVWLILASTGIEDAQTYLAQKSNQWRWGNTGLCPNCLNPRYDRTYGQIKDWYYLWVETGQMILQGGSPQRPPWNGENDFLWATTSKSRFYSPVPLKLIQYVSIDRYYICSSNSLSGGFY